MTDIYWSLPKKPHVSSLPNLRKITRYMMENGYVTPNNVISARQVSIHTGIAYTQILNLLDKPGFVRVVSHGRQVGWYYLAHLGIDYPDTFPNDMMLRSTFLNQKTEVITEGESKVVSQLLKPGQVLIEPGDPVAGNHSISKIQLEIVNVVSRVASNERSPKEAAEWLYRIADGIRSGTLTISSDN